MGGWREGAGGKGTEDECQADIHRLVIRTERVAGSILARVEPSVVFCLSSQGPVEEGGWGGGWGGPFFRALQ